MLPKKTNSKTRLVPSLDQVRVAKAQKCLLSFMRYVWWMPGALFIGLHTLILTKRITQAVEDFKNGISTFLIVELPYRHGKSDIVSRALPPFFLGACHDLQPDVILSGYGQKLVEQFSQKNMQIISSRAYRKVFRKTRLCRYRRAIDRWGIMGSSGTVLVSGLGGALTGSGGHLMILDDYCKSREEAESPTYREKTWCAFKDDFMTRRAPVSIVIICATRWNVDDIIGRIRKEREKNPDFPSFESLTFPAVSDDYPTGYLFPERFDEQWYREQRATLGKYSAAALLDQNPQPRGGNRFTVDRIVIHNSIDDFPDIEYVRFWDLASTDKERAGDDPDATVGSLQGVDKVGGMQHLWIKDIVSVQAEAPRRNEIIRSTAMQDGAHVPVGVEVVAGYKDAYTILKDILKGIRTVQKVTVSGDKSVRAAPIEPIMEAGHVHILRAPWNDAFIDEFGAFPGGKHDDIVDSVSGGYKMQTKRSETTMEGGAFEGVGVY
jgi:predicted phage terminase large subunit-like protein